MLNQANSLVDIQECTVYMMWAQFLRAVEVPTGSGVWIAFKSCWYVLIESNESFLLAILSW